MYEAIQKNQFTAEKRRIAFFLAQTDGITPATGKTGTVKLSFNYAAYVTSTNSIVERDAVNAPGAYYLELTQTEANTALGTVTGSLAPTGCARTPIYATIISDDVTAASPLDAPQSELGAPPAIDGATLVDQIRWVFHRWRNPRRTTASGRTVYKADGTTALGAATLADDGTNFDESAEA